uniref:DUF834 domain-containing protein n=1 Tax=Oryza meridionalis TaxID=40149 RepID=A0A0E0E9L7_9ORYZ
MAAARPTPDGAPSPRVDGGSALGGRLTTRRGDGGSSTAAAGSGLPTVGSGGSTLDLAGGGGGWRLAAGACGGCGGDGEATVAEAVEVGARGDAAGGRRVRRPRTAMRPEAAEAGAHGGRSGSRSGGRVYSKFSREI